MRNLVIVTLGLTLAACGGSDSGTIETEDGTVEYETERSGGNSEMRITDNEGNEVVVNSGEGVAASLPDGFTVYPGAEVVSSTVMNGTEGQGSMTMMTSSDTPEQMVAHVRREAEAAGFSIEMEMTSNETMMIGGEGPDGTAFSFNVSRSGDESSGMLIVGRE
ncbi:hypothetical protein [Erythrobacter sp. EC-HK427]|uniref:hypothetical protein n=1 Tax=Erythrobacter sp. EC-HK427 TaxID=2038396 RepID=UPI0012511FF9|nr:hypothetical protein [Erythrobacter sp. EC-HK427]VVT20359.1 conserved hypothetical protein [Erythrobacter sp. EC-HK427]